MDLKRNLTTLDIFCIATGAMISSGIFILPGIAFARTGPAVFVSYGLAGVLAMMGMLSVAELATAMPKAGGDYFFITRTLGPLIGTISGLLSWFALTLKGAFAVYGIAEVAHVILGWDIIASGLAVTVLFMIINILGVKVASRFEVVSVAALIALMTWYIVFGISRVEVTHFQPFTPYGLNAVVSTAGFVFISFGGLLKVASVSGEIDNPRRTIPLGLLSSLVVVIVLYVALLFVTTGIAPGDLLAGSLTPVADTARLFAGTPGYVVITIAALLAFVTTANAGILSASRYPMALSHDNLLPPLLGRVSARFGSPVAGVILTGVCIGGSLFLELTLLVKAASAVILAAYVLTSLSVLILRGSRIQSYRPTFRAPLYPYLQIAAIVLFIFLIADTGADALRIVAGIVLLGAGLYIFYGRRRASAAYALLHLIGRVTNRRIADSGRDLETELRDIIHERDRVALDRFDRLITQALILDLDGPLALDDFFRAVTARCECEKIVPETDLLALLYERESQSSTALSPFIAIPHIIVEGDHIFEIVIARCRGGIRFSPENDAVKAVFVIIGTIDERRYHLQVLSAIAQIVHERGFEGRWLAARGPEQLRDLLLLSERRRFA